MIVKGGLYRGRMVREQSRHHGSRPKKGEGNDQPPDPAPPGGDLSRPDQVRYRGRKKDKRSPQRQIQKKGKREAHLLSFKMRSSSWRSSLPSRRERTKWASIGESAPSKT